jgi:hypothetical protein
VRRVLTFHQKPFIADYVKMCTQNRKAASTKAESDMWKILSNSLYGKMVRG